MDVHIYTLSDPITNEIRYVGKTIMKLSTRLNCHLQERRFPKRNIHKVNWIQSLKSRNLKPIIKSIEICDELVWQVREKFWIKHFRDVGVRLTNHSSGGEGMNKGYVRTTMTDLQRIKISNSLKDYYKNNKYSRLKCIEAGKMCKGIRKKNSKNRYIGVSKLKNDSGWRAYHSVGPKQFRIGTFPSEEMAYEQRELYLKSMNEQISSKNI